MVIPCHGTLDVEEIPVTKPNLLTELKSISYQLEASLGMIGLEGKPEINVREIVHVLRRIDSLRIHLGEKINPAL
jgi:hypothetical protein